MLTAAVPAQGYLVLILAAFVAAFWLAGAAAFKCAPRCVRARAALPARAAAADALPAPRYLNFNRR